MDRSEPHFVPGGYERIQSSLKRQLRTPKDNYVIQFHDHEEPTSAPNTPGMTTDSTRSASSSIVACDSCGNPSNHYQCSSRSQSDLDSLHFHSSETESIPASPVIPLQAKDGFRPHRTILQNVVDAHIANATPRGKRSFSPLAGACALHNDQHQNQEIPLRLRYANCSLENVSRPINIPGSLPASANPTFDDSGSEMTDDEDHSMDEEDDNNDWGGPDASLEALVLDAMGGDETLAAQLIPVLHKAFQSDLAQKVVPWRSAVTERGPSNQATNGGQSHSSGPSSNESPANPRKRQRRQETDQEPDEDDDDDDEREDRKNSRELEDDFDPSSPVPSPRLACPFYKLNPSKYGVQHGASGSSGYRTCAGPGFKNIQRLKEHLKRKHYPVQCDRCYQIFPGSDRSSCVLALENHRKLPNPCQLLDPTLKEGISDAQWAKLDKKRSPKKTQPSRVEKYWEIWDTIFPGRERPKTPWYDGSTNPMPFSEESRQFSEIFRSMLGFQVNDQQIRFPDGLEEESMARLQLLAQKAFSAYVNVHGFTSSTQSGSTRSRPPSSTHLGSSYGIISRPSRTRGQHSSSTSLSTTATGSRVYSMDMQASPTGPVMMTDSRNQGAMAPPFMSVSPMVQQNFVNNSLGVSIPNQQPQIGFNSGVPDTMSNYDNGNYTYSTAWGNEFDPASDMAAGPPANNLNSGNFGSQPRSSLSQNRIGSDPTHEITGLGWHQHIQDAQHRYYGEQQP